MRVEHAQNGGGDGDDELEYKFPIDAFHSDYFFLKTPPHHWGGEDGRFKVSDWDLRFLPPFLRRVSSCPRGSWEPPEP